MVKKENLKPGERFSNLLLDIIEQRKNMSTRVYFTQDIREELARNCQGHDWFKERERGYDVTSCMGVVGVSFLTDQEITNPVRGSKKTIYLVSSLKLDGETYPFSTPLTDSHTSINLLVKRE